MPLNNLLTILYVPPRKTSERHDVCMSAQEKLHPVCAQRPADNLIPLQPAASSGTSMMYQPPPACHTVAKDCKEDPECRGRLEHYEQACAIDSVTLKCAGRSAACRSAMLGILGTPLRTTCGCQASETLHLYMCLGWHRLLWLNPCIVESQKDFHMKRLAELGLLDTTTMAPTTTTAATTTTTTTTLAPHTVRSMTSAPRWQATSTTAAPVSLVWRLMK